MADVRKRISDLLRTAAPDSGATDNERQIAAVEAASLIAKHGYVVTEPPTPRKRKPPTPRPPPRPHRDPYNDGYSHSPYGDVYSSANWTETVVPHPCICDGCGRLIHAGEDGWWDAIRGWRHHDITCR